MCKSSFVNTILDEIIPLTRKTISSGNKIFGAAILNKKDFSTIVIGTNKEIIKPSDNLLEFAAGQYDDPKYKLGEHEWPALKRMLKKNNSIYDQ